MKYPRIVMLCCLLLTALLTLSARAANSVLLWPIDPKIASGEKATELWMENRGDSTTLMQVRVFLWQQKNGQEQYQTQQQILASPPMVRIEPGKKQLIRLIKQAAPAAGAEAAYRILLDEIPTPPSERSGKNHAGLSFQMRYSVPLFVYGEGASADKTQPQLSWRLVNRDGKQAIEVTNGGNGFARLSHVALGGRMIADSLLGYVLAHSTNTFPINFPASGREELSARLGNKQVWRSASQPR